MSEQMPRPRKTPSSIFKKKLQKEANSMCPFCGNSAPSSWEFHHIDGDRGNNTYENLIMVCGGCHNKITAGEISEADVRLKKTIIMWNANKEKPEKSDSQERQISNNAVGNTGCIINQNVHIGKMPSTRIEAAPDSIGANAKAKNYTNYLVQKLCDYRMKNKVFATEEERKKANTKCMQIIRSNLKRHFKVTSYHAISIDRQDDLFQYIKSLIDKTKQGRINKTHEVDSYIPFDEYQA